VVDRLGAVVWNAEVTAGTPPDWDHAVRTDHAGHFVLGQLTPGDRVLAARHQDQSVISDQTTRIYEGQETPGVVLRLGAVVDDAQESKPTHGANAATGAASDPTEALPTSEEPPPLDAAVAFAARGEQVVIDRIAPGTPSASAGLQMGDILLAINGVPVRSPTQARELLRPSAAPHGAMVVFEISRGGHGFRIHIATH
jgi:membrane-associated protease RseP (regulator of RpoE activity)